MTIENNYEKLGLMYLGKEIDLDSKQQLDIPFLLKNKNLTTHAMIIGMTGSGKTGLGIGVIEEAVMDNIPAIVIDPKGDMGNLLLTFPDLDKEDFKPWVDQADAARKSMSVEQYAEKTAQVWKEGLESWGQSGKRLAAMKEKADFTIYTPGSTSGVSVSVLNSFDPPSEELLRDIETLNNMVDAAVSSLLSLIGIAESDMQSKEHILICSILLFFWRKKKGLDLATLISNVVNPPFEKIGVLSLETFFKQSERMELAMSLNNIIASPTFSSWINGENLDIQKLLYTEDGKARIAIFSLSHLGDEERMFFVTMLLNQFVAWMRRQRGSSTLKTLLYMDEIYGFFPPTANPPSKKPMMLLLKQARAYGVGVVLSTQNPVDLDYKGLSNMGTWFIGRLQTTQDQEKVVDGIVGSSDGNLDKKKVKQLLSDLKGRQFLLNSAHLEMPTLFQTRWVMSYLKGPLSAVDIAKLMEKKKREAKSSEEIIPEYGTRTEAIIDHPPLLADTIDQYYFLSPVLAETITFEPWIGAVSSVRFYNQKRNIDQVKVVKLRFYLEEDYAEPNWSEAEELAARVEELDSSAPDNCSYYTLPDDILALKDFRQLEKDFSDYLYQTERLELFRVSSLKFESMPDETLGDYKIRLSDFLREEKEKEVEKLQQKYAARQRSLEKQIQTALAKIEKEKVDVKSKTTDTIISFGSAILGAFFGRKTLSAGTIYKASTGMKSVGRIAKEKEDVKRAQQKAEALEQELVNLSQEIQDKVTAISDSYSIENLSIETFSIKPRRSDIFDHQVFLLWEMVPPAPSAVSR